MQSPFMTAKMQQLMPRIITRRDIIRRVPQRWRDSYPDDSRRLAHDRAGDIRAGLEALDLETATAEDVARVIGNPSWTDNRCNVCEIDRDAVVSVPREYDTPLTVCRDCAAGIVAVFDGEHA